MPGIHFLPLKNDRLERGHDFLPPKGDHLKPGNDGLGISHGVLPPKDDFKDFWKDSWKDSWKNNSKKNESGGLGQEFEQSVDTDATATQALTWGGRAEKWVSS